MLKIHVFIMEIFDVVPIKLLKSCMNAFVPLITKSVNLSLEEGLFPDEFNHAVVWLLLKKACLPTDDI